MSREDLEALFRRSANCVLVTHPRNVEISKNNSCKFLIILFSHHNCSFSYSFLNNLREVKKGAGQISKGGNVCLNHTHAKYLVLLCGILILRNLKLISQTVNDLKSCRGQFMYYCIQFLICYHKKMKTINDQKRTLSIHFWLVSGEGSDIWTDLCSLWSSPSSS